MKFHEWLLSQPLLPRGEQFGFLTRLRGKCFVARPDEKLTAFLALESAIRINSIDAVGRRLAKSHSR